MLIADYGSSDSESDQHETNSNYKDFSSYKSFNSLTSPKLDNNKNDNKRKTPVHIKAESFKRYKTDNNDANDNDNDIASLVGESSKTSGKSKPTNRDNSGGLSSLLGILPAPKKSQNQCQSDNNVEIKKPKSDVHEDDDNYSKPLLNIKQSEPLDLFSLGCKCHL